MSSANVVKSFFLGVVIGLALQAIGPGAVDLLERVVTVLACGGVGLLVGLVTEWVTSLLPVRRARTGTYFVVNNLVALAVTSGVLAVVVGIHRGDADDRGGWWVVVVLVLAIVTVANAVDYALYRRTQARLRAVQTALGDPGDARATRGGPPDGRGPSGIPD